MNDNDLKTNGAISSGLMTFTVGALVGAGVALLFAPEPGHKMRARLTSTARRVGKGAAQIGSDAQSAIQAGRNAFLEERDGRRSRDVAGETAIG